MCVSVWHCVLGLCECQVAPQAPNQAWRLEAVLVSGHHTWSERAAWATSVRRKDPLVLPHQHQIKAPYLKLGQKNTGPLFHSKSIHTHTQWAGLIRFNYTRQLSVINCDAPLRLWLCILVFLFKFKKDCHTFLSIAFEDFPRIYQAQLPQIKHEPTMAPRLVTQTRRTIAGFTEAHITTIKERERFECVNASQSCCCRQVSLRKCLSLKSWKHFHLGLAFLLACCNLCHSTSFTHADDQPTVLRDTHADLAYLLTKLKKELQLTFLPKYGHFCIFNEWLLMYFQKLLKALISPLNLNTLKDFKDLTNNNTSAIESSFIHVSHVHWLPQLS